MAGNRKKYIFLLLSFIGWFIVGIFMSLNADRIVGIGDSFKITQDNKIYMTPKYITKECLETIFTIMSSYKIVHGVATVKTITELPDNVYKLLNSLRNEYADIESTTKKYNEMIERNNENSKTILELKIALTVKKQFIEQINKICYNTLPIIDNRVEEINEDNLRDYINAITNKKNLRKRDLMAKFPTLQSIIGQMTVQQLWEKYKVITK